MISVFINKSIKDMSPDLINAAIKFLFPRGTRGDDSGILLHPVWPPDLFGASAHIASITDCYTELLDFNAGSGIGLAVHNSREDLQCISQSMSDITSLDSYPDKHAESIQRWWSNLISVTQDSHDIENSWQVSLIKLLIVADMACEGIGFFEVDEPLSSDAENPYIVPGWIGQIYDWMSIPAAYEKFSNPGLLSSEGWFWDIQEVIRGTSPIDDDRSPPSSACILIPAQRLCVLPKALTPVVGCTIRSLTQNLSLHPGSDQVKSRWYNRNFNSGFEADRESLNILVVPYPFRVSSKDFVAYPTDIETFHTFSVEPNWLNEEPIEDIVESLFNAARKEGRQIDVVIFPELAFTAERFVTVKDRIAAISNNFILVIAGISYEGDRGYPVNASITAYINAGANQASTPQKKHHRWKLDGDQVRTYCLDSELDPKEDWWENIDISGRSVDYHVFQKGSCFATLICEDLARQDPCKPSIQAVGPNLIFALLMDSPQFKNRWPGRYTLGLTEDPGSSVLTVTSLGLVERSNWAHNGNRRTIALWGDQTGIREIDLPVGHLGVLLGLARVPETLYTLDNREGGGQFWQLRTLLPLKDYIELNSSRG